MDAPSQQMADFAGKILTDLGAAAVGSLVVIGDKLSLYKTLSESDSLTSTQLAERAGVTERYVREWLAANAASGYVNYDASTKTFSMSPEQTAVFADEESPFFMAGGFASICSLYIDEPKITEAFRSGKGVGWQEHSSCLFCGTERFFGPAYRTNLVQSWIPSLQGVEEKLRRGAQVLDVGCGHGLSTFLMAQAFPKSKFVGIDFHKESIARADQHAKEHKLTNLSFEVADASGLKKKEIDLITMFDCLHDMGDPVSALKSAREALASDGTVMVVEPLAGDTLEENLNPLGRAYYAFSTMICVPASLNQPGQAALGAQAGEARLRGVFLNAGFKVCKRATETPTNIVLEARA